MKKGALKEFGGLLFFFFVLSASLQAQLNLLHSFSGSDGKWPPGSLTLDGSTLYGMTNYGGAYDKGTIFKINTDGTGFALLHTFEGTPSDGGYPLGSLTLSGFTLYGMTAAGGITNEGTIFKINTDGTEFALLFSFPAPFYDSGGEPHGSLTLDGSTLYGTTYISGNTFVGTIFKINTDGTGYAQLHLFAADGSEGLNPRGSLTLSGSTLYGMTYQGGISDNGTIFRMNTDGTGFVVLHALAGGPEEGSKPYDSLTLIGSTLYGMTERGGAYDKGTIFQINTDGTGFAVLHSFDGTLFDGAFPRGSLTLVDSMLYGMTSEGGADGAGTIFQINTDGSGFAVLHSFIWGQMADGSFPNGSLAFSDYTLYGMTVFGGNSSLGTVFSYGLPRPQADISIAKSVDNLTPLQASEFNFNITATNNGPAGASGLKVADQLPEGLSFISSTPSQGTYDPGTGVWDIGTLAKDASETMTIKVKAINYGSITNTASRSALTESDPNSSNDSASVTVNVAPLSVDVQVTKAVSTKNPKLHSNIVFSITIKNKGKYTASGLKVTDVIPPGLTYLYSTPVGAYDPVTGIWNVGTLPPGISVRMAVTCRCDVTGANSNTATKTFQNELDPRAGNDSSTVTFTVK